ncbi:Nn.00g115830.m01.CDS01 [Neocucurbitaria sp. VM-36]
MHRRFAALLFYLPYVLTAPWKPLEDSAYTSIEASNLLRTLKVRIAALICSGVSMMASIVAFYWFFRMEKRFRHRLIMLLVYGDLMRATWFFVFAVITLSRGAVRTQSSFCQSSGFLIQYGTETSDYAVLVIAVNSALQVFRPGRQTTSEGLYPFQRYVYAGAFLIPILMSGLAFINTRWGYQSQGAFCTLPIRPFWYRLALAWIPRYLIALTIIGIAIAIYAYVGFEFRAYSTLTQSIRTSLMETQELQDEREPEVRDDAPAMTEQEPVYGRRASSIAHDIVSSKRRGSSVSFSCAGHNANHASGASGIYTHSLPNSSTNLYLKRNETMRPPLSAIPSASTVQTPVSAKDIGTPPSSSGNVDADRSPLSQDLKPLQNMLARSPSPSPSPCSSPRQGQIDHENARMKRKAHAHVHRQLQLMFVYPLAYTLMWLLPFVQHCTMYQDKYVNQPIWFLRLGGTICQTSMGFVDCLIFSLREKPWQNIPNSDGTFWGSFAVFRKPKATHGEARGKGVSDGGRGGGQFPMQRTTVDSGAYRTTRVQGTGRMSASSNEYAMAAAEQARVRLEHERDERLTALRARVVKRHASLRSAERADHADNGSESDYDDGEGEEEKRESMPGHMDDKRRESFVEV